MTKTDRVRVHLELTPDAAERLDRLKAKEGMKTRTEVIRRALVLYEWMLAEGKDGVRFWKGTEKDSATEVVVLRW